jgi:hypothetical protein
MRRYQKIKLSALFLCCICLFPILTAKADVAAAEEWVDIDVVVNIIDASDANNVDAIIKRANEILKQAHIRLIVKKTNRNVNVGNGDGNLTADEGDTAQEDGQKRAGKSRWGWQGDQDNYSRRCLGRRGCNDWLVCSPQPSGLC